MMPVPGAKKGADANDVVVPYRCYMATCKGIVMIRITVFWDLKEAAGSSDTSVHVHHTKYCHMSEDRNLYSRHLNQESFIEVILLFTLDIHGVA